MQGVTKGTAPKASVFGYQVAGKTGTAYKFVNGQYDTSRRRTFFCRHGAGRKTALSHCRYG